MEEKDFLACLDFFNNLSVDIKSSENKEVVSATYHYKDKTYTTKPLYYKEISNLDTVKDIDGLHLYFGDEVFWLDIEKHQWPKDSGENDLNQVIDDMTDDNEFKEFLLLLANNNKNGYIQRITQDGRSAQYSHNLENNNHWHDLICWIKESIKQKGENIDKSFFQHLVFNWNGDENDKKRTSLDRRAQNKEPYGIVTCLNENIKKLSSKMYINDCIKIIKNNYNLILTGAPGTGKTYLAKQIASLLILNKPYSDGLTNEDKNKITNHYKFVQFHPSYDYTDFVEGLRPTPPDNNGNIGFIRKDGIFKDFCRGALTNKTSLRINDFESIYQSVYDDIANGTVKQLNNPQYGSFDVTIKSKQIVFGNRRTGDNFKTESKGNLKLMFDYYVSNNIFDLSDFSRDDYFKLISDLTEESTKTIDYTYYYGILQEMLKRVDNKQINDNSIYVFVIDEINRGEISKIFGELFFSIEPSYRGEKGRVQTQYQNMITDKNDPFYEGFYVPENVYIIGTMNDIDRSVESMDFAMRRRFAWKEIEAKDNTGMLDDLDNIKPGLKDEVINKMNKLNEKIEKTDDLNSSYHIGGAYFSKLGLYLDKDHTPADEDIKEAYEKLWDNHLNGLLFEYIRGMQDTDSKMNQLKAAYDGTAHA